MDKPIWGKDGLVAMAAENVGEIPFEARPDQERFALLTRGLLERSCDSENTVIAMIEGGTGIGKTRGYLVEGCRHISLAGKGKMLIATHTLGLMKQIMGTDVSGDDGQATGSRDRRVATMVAHMECQIREAAQGANVNHRQLRFARQMGRRNFLSPARMTARGDEIKANGDMSGWMAWSNRVSEVREHYARAAVLLALPAEEFKDSQRAEAEALIQAVNTQAFVDAVYGVEDAASATELVDDICLLDTSPPQDHVVYLLARRLAEEADVLVTTHASVACALGYRSLPGLSRADVGEEDGGEGFNQYSFLVIDEADQWAEAAEAALTLSVSLASVERAVRRARDALRESPLRKVVDKATEAALEALAALRAHAPGEPGVTAPLGGAATLCLGQISDQLETIAEALRKEGPDGGDGGTLESMGRRIARLARTMRSNDDFWSVRWRTSPKQALPSIEQVSAVPGRILKRIWTPREGQEQLVRAVLLTSATLRTPGKFRPENEWVDIEVSTGIRPETYPLVHRDLCAAIHPKDYGTLSARFADPNAPIPKRENWKMPEDVLGHWKALLERVHAAGGRALVLAPSYADVEELAPHISDIAGVMMQQRGQRLEPFVDKFIRHPSAMLVTAHPGAWAGLDLRGFIKHVVVLRLPYPPPRDSETGFNGLCRIGMLKKLAQGIGRAVRTQQSVATFWCGDPRMGHPQILTDITDKSPLKSAARDDNALYAIPERFRRRFETDPGSCGFALDIPRPLPPTPGRKAGGSKRKAR